MKSGQKGIPRDQEFFKIPDRKRTKDDLHYKLMQTFGFGGVSVKLTSRPPVDLQSKRA